MHEGDVEKQPAQDIELAIIPLGDGAPREGQALLVLCVALRHASVDVSTDLIQQDDQRQPPEGGLGPGVILSSCSSCMILDELPTQFCVVTASAAIPIRNPYEDLRKVPHIDR